VGGLPIVGLLGDFGALVDRQFVWFDVNCQQGNSLLTQDFSFSCDEAFVVRGFETRLQTLQTLFEFRKFLVEIRLPMAPPLPGYVAIAIIVQIQIATADSVFIEVDSVHPAHKHEACAPSLADHFFQRFPVGVHTSSIRLFTVASVFAERSAEDTFGLARS